MGSGRSAGYGLVAMLAVLLSAGGIAYMASVSYPDELGIVDARRRQHQEKARQIVQGVREGMGEELDAVIEAPSTQASGTYFVLGGNGEIVAPPPTPLKNAQESMALGLLPERGFQTRQRNLQRAQAMEETVCQKEQTCSPDLVRLRSTASQYESLEMFSDTGAEALLGLARLHRLGSQPDLAASRYRQLAERFGDRGNEVGVPYGLLADMGLSEVSQSAGATLSLLRQILSAQYNAPNALLEVAALQALESLESMSLSGAAQGEYQSLRRAMELASQQSLLAKRLSSRGPELATSATGTVKSVVAPWDGVSTLLYKKAADGKVYGIVRTENELQERAIFLAGTLGLHETLRVRIENSQTAQESETIPTERRRAKLSLAPWWPHLALVLWQEGPGSDGMGDIAEARRRHRAITGGLIAVLVLGLFATIRGAARERELARLKSDFVSTVSHELKTPLTSIRMFAEMLQEGVAGEDREREARYQGIIIKESERLGLLIANLLDYSQIERGNRKYSEEEQRLSSIAREAEQTFARFGEGASQRLSVTIAVDAEEALVHADRNVMVQCVLNLLSNAAKYGGEERIELRVQRDAEAGVITLSVRDHGPGISSSEQAKIFREFYRSPDAMKSAVEGTGLGLALVKRHVQAHGGQVHVESVLGAGATFTIVLPEVR